jgi:hypothetical protein
MKARQILWAILLVALILPASARASSVVVLQQRTGVYEGTRDAWLDETSTQRNNNNGGDVDLCVKYNGGYSDCILVKFDLTGQIPANQRILAATLTMYYNDENNMGGSDDAITIKPYRVNADKAWDENTGVNLNGQGVSFKYRDQWELYPWHTSGPWNDCTDDGNGTAKLEGPSGTVPGAVKPGNPVDFSVTQSVSLWYGTNNNGLTNNGWLLVAVANQGAGDVKYGFLDSSEKYSYNWYNNPKLSITYEGALRPAAEAAGPYLCSNPGSVQLNGAGSYDPDGGSIQAWNWDLDGDLDFNDAAGVAPILSFDYLHNTLNLGLGDHSIYLRVQDDENEWCLAADPAVLTLQDASSVGLPVRGPLPSLTASPNPFSIACQLRYDLPAAGGVQIQVLDVSGRVVRNLMASRQIAGPGRITWNGMSDEGSLVPSGIYLARVTAPRVAGAVRLTLVR